MFLPKSNLPCFRILTLRDSRRWRRNCSSAYRASPPAYCRQGYTVRPPLAIAEVPEDALSRGLAHLQSAEFLYETNLFPDLEYTLKHALTHEVAYGSMLQERRQTHHVSIMQAMERMYAERMAEHVERLAYHAVRGEVWEKALNYNRQLGARGVEQRAYRESMMGSEQALEALTHLPEDPDTPAL